MCARFPRPLRALCAHAEFLPRRLLPHMGAGPGAGRCALMQVMFPAGSAAAGSGAKASDGWPVCWWGRMGLCPLLFGGTLVSLFYGREESFILKNRVDKNTSWNFSIQNLKNESC